MHSSARYEAFIANLATAICSNRCASEVRYGLRNQVDGNSGVRHQIDVSFIDKDTIPPTLVVVECKHINRPIKLAYVKVLKATVDDIAQKLGPAVKVKGVLVSLHGAQKGAIKYAAFYNIDIQAVSDGSFYRFKYADLELVASSFEIPGKSSARFSGVAVRACKLCGTHFEGDGTKDTCEACP